MSDLNYQANLTGTPVRDYFLTNKMYDRLKIVLQVIIPTLGVLYFLIAIMSDWDHTTSVLGILFGVELLLAVVLRISTISYNSSRFRYDGALVITTTDEDAYLYALELNDNPLAFSTRKSIEFKVALGEGA